MLWDVTFVMPGCAVCFNTLVMSDDMSEDGYESIFTHNITIENRTFSIKEKSPCIIWVYMTITKSKILDDPVNELTGSNKIKKIQTQPSHHES